MSTTQDIWDVYRDEIVEKSRRVYQKGGIMPFYAGYDLRVKAIYEDFMEIAPASSEE